MTASSSDVAEALVRFMCSGCPEFGKCGLEGEEMNDQIIECIPEKLRKVSL